MDFTLDKYAELLRALLSAGYSFLTYGEWLDGAPHPTRMSSGGTVILRHDVDLKPYNSLATAQMEHSLGIRASYYFRAVPQSWDEGVIREIAAMGHEVGYHYESLTTCAGDVDRAYEDFCMNLQRLRRIVPVRTICMHGSPRSPWDSKDIWKKYDYKPLGIVGEPYLDTDWSDVFYLTDTGRRWDGYKVSVRDRIPHWQEVWNGLGLTFHSTDDIIHALRSACSGQVSPDIVPESSKRGCAGRIPFHHVMITTHPQRWMPFGAGWLKELLLQNAKNLVKRLLAKR